MALSREERETVLILNDKGEITISTNSPAVLKRLTKRLGAPHRQEVGWWEWEFTTLTCTFKLPAKRRAPSPSRIEAGRRLALGTQKPQINTQIPEAAPALKGNLHTKAR